jgi:hypothetical protein
MTTYSSREDDALRPIIVQEFLARGASLWALENVEKSRVVVVVLTYR